MIIFGIEPILGPFPRITREVEGTIGRLIERVGTDGVDLPGLRRIFSGEEPRPVRAEADGLTLMRVLYPAGVDPFV